MQLSIPPYKRWVIQRVDPGLVDDVKTLAARHHVSVASVLEEAVWNFQTQLGKTIPLPDGWRMPRDF